MVSEQSSFGFWRSFFALLFVTVVAQLANVFYQKHINNEPILSVLFPSLIFLSIVTIPALLIGLKLGPSMNLGLVNKETGFAKPLQRGLLFATITAIPLGFFLLGLREVLRPYLPVELPEYGFRGITGGLLVSIGAAVGEEVWFRFGLFTLMLFGIKKLGFKVADGNALIVMVVVGIAFASAHFPQLASYGAASSSALIGTLLGNLAVSMLYGWCFWRYGLISAITAHFALDIVLHALPAL